MRMDQLDSMLSNDEEQSPECAEIAQVPSAQVDHRHAAVAKALRIPSFRSVETRDKELMLARVHVSCESHHERFCTSGAQRVHEPQEPDRFTHPRHRRIILRSFLRSLSEAPRRATKCSARVMVASCSAP